MEFTLNNYNRNVTDEELINDLLRVAKILNKENLSMPEYQQKGKYHPSTLARRFGGWRTALKRAGLSLNKSWYKHEFCEKEEDFLHDMQNVAIMLGKNSITYGEYKQYGKYKIKNKHDSWDVLLKLANLKSTPYRLGKGKEISDKELFQDIERVWIKLGRQPTITDIRNGEFNFSQNTFTRRFGGWRKTLEAFVYYINNNTDDSEILRDTTDEDRNINSPNENKSSYYKHKTKREPSNRLKVQVLMRDGNRCRICGVACNNGIHKIHFDHIIPWAKGGETTLENLQVLCSDCNATLGDLDK